MDIWTTNKKKSLQALKSSLFKKSKTYEPPPTFSKTPSLPKIYTPRSGPQKSLKPYSPKCQSLIKLSVLGPLPSIRLKSHIKDGFEESAIASPLVDNDGHYDRDIEELLKGL